MRRNARIRWLGSEFKSSHRRRRSKKVGNMPFAQIKKTVAKKLHLFLGAKLFNRIAICLNINFHKPHPCRRIYKKQILHQVDEKLEVPPRPGKDNEPATSYYAANTDLRQYQRGPWSREDTCSILNRMPCLRVSYTAAVLRLYILRSNH